MYASLMLSALLTVAAPAPVFQLTPEEETALKDLKPFGFKALEDTANKSPYGTGLKYNWSLGYDRKRGKLIPAHRPSDKDLAPLAKLRRLRSLTARGAPFSDSTLGYLHDMTRLHALDLCHTTVTDEGLKKLAGLPRLGRQLEIRIEEGKMGVERKEEASHRKNLVQTGPRSGPASVT